MRDYTGTPYEYLFPLEAQGSTIIVEVFYKDTSGGGLIVIPNQSRKRHSIFRGRVKSIGPKYPYKEVKVDSWVLFRRNEGIEIKDGNRTYLSLKEKWVEGLIDGGK